MGTTDSPTVLIVDDEPTLLDLYAHFLEEDFTVRTADSGGEALDGIDDSVDVVLLDRRMPDMSGSEVLERIRARGVDCSVAMVSAVEPDFDVIDMGFDDYIVKPVTRDDLRDLVETLLTRSAYDDVVREYFAVASKLTLLESEKSMETLEGSEEYAELTDRFDDVKREARTLLAEMSADEFEALFREFDSPTDVLRRTDDDS